MKCYDCGKRDCDRVYIPIPVITYRPCVCAPCLEKRKLDPNFGKYNPRELRDA